MLDGPAGNVTRGYRCEANDQVAVHGQQRWVGLAVLNDPVRVEIAQNGVGMPNGARSVLIV